MNIENIEVSMYVVGSYVIENYKTGTYLTSIDDTRKKILITDENIEDITSLTGISKDDILSVMNKRLF